MFDDLVEDISESWTASGSTEAEEESSAVGEAVDVATDDSSLWKSEGKFLTQKNEAKTNEVSGRGTDGLLIATEKSVMIPSGFSWQVEKLS